MDFTQLLHPRIVDTCFKLFDDEHYSHAAVEAMKQVEIALKEKCVARKAFGRRLVQRAFGEKATITLSVPLGEQSQEDARLFFEGAFAYYRNYAFHDGTNIDKTIAARVMVIASDLLDIIGASRRSFTGAGGVEGLVREEIFDSADEFYGLLRWLDEQYTLDETVDGLFEELYKNGFSDLQVECVFDLDLVTMRQEAVAGDDDLGGYGPTTMETIELTEQGNEVLKQAEQE